MPRCMAAARERVYRTLSMLRGEAFVASVAMPSEAGREKVTMPGCRRLFAPFALNCQRFGTAFASCIPSLALSAAGRRHPRRLRFIALGQNRKPPCADPPC